MRWWYSFEQIRFVGKNKQRWLQLRRRKRCKSVQETVKVSWEKRLWVVAILRSIKTHSATAGAFRETEFVSTTNPTTFASDKWSLNWSLSLGWPGMSMILIGLFDEDFITDTFVCIDIWVGNVWLYASYSSFKAWNCEWPQTNLG